MERTCDETFIMERICEDEIRWNMLSECSKMRSESSEYMFGRQRVLFINSWTIKIALESYFEEHAQEVWERNWIES